MAPASSANKLRNRIFFVVTNVISVICLAWTLHGANLGELRREVVHLDWRWAVGGMIFGVLAFAVQGWRWQLVLQPISPIPLWDFIRSIYIGLFANEVIPLRAGEIIRCYLLAKWGEIPVSVSLASALIERILDGIWLVACLFVTSHYVHLPAEFMAGGYFLIALLVVCGALVGLAMFWKQQTLDYVLGAKWLGWVHTLIEDLHLIGHSRYLYYAAIVSLPYILLQAVPIYAMIRSYAHLHDVSVYAAFALMVILRLGAVVPQAPGNVGTFNGITVLGLHLFGVPFPVAKRFSIILWASMTLPLLVVGFVAVVISEVNMGEIHKHARDHMRRKDPRLDETTVP